MVGGFLSDNSEIKQDASKPDDEDGFINNSKSGRNFLTS
jgi:hypothetical protein